MEANIYVDSAHPTSSAFYTQVGYRSTSSLDRRSLAIPMVLENLDFEHVSSASWHYNRRTLRLWVGWHHSRLNHPLFFLFFTRKAGQDVMRVRKNRESRNPKKRVASSEKVSLRHTSGTKIPGQSDNWELPYDCIAGNSFQYLTFHFSAISLFRRDFRHVDYLKKQERSWSWPQIVGKESWESRKTVPKDNIIVSNRPSRWPLSSRWLNAGREVNWVPTFSNQMR